MTSPDFDLSAVRAQVPLLATHIPMNACSQAPQSTPVRAAADRYLASWNEAGMEFYTTESGLQFVDFLTGEGEFPELGSTVIVHYSGYLDDATLFDSSYLRGRPVEFVLTEGQLIRGFVEGLLTMRAGGMRKLVIPPFLGYGEDGFGKKVPPNATLIYDRNPAPLSILSVPPTMICWITAAIAI